jgi:hypothetical protein
MKALRLWMRDCGRVSKKTCGSMFGVIGEGAPWPFNVRP